jgi:hypothetical protein
MGGLQVSGRGPKRKRPLGTPRSKWEDCKVLEGTLKERNHFEDLGVNGRIAGFSRGA